MLEQLLWIVFLGLAYALIIQSRSANLGVVTGKISKTTTKDYNTDLISCLII